MSESGFRLVGRLKQKDMSGTGMGIFERPVMSFSRNSLYFSPLNDFSADELTTNVIKWRKSLIKFNYEKHQDLLWCDCMKTWIGKPWCKRVTASWTNWYFEDGNGDNCNRPTKIGVFGSYANHSPTKNHGAPDQL